MNTIRDYVSPMNAHFFRGNPTVERILFADNVPTGITAELLNLNTGQPLATALQPTVVYVTDGVEIRYPGTTDMPEMCERKVSWAGSVQVYGQILTDREPLEAEEQEPLYFTTPTGQDVEASVKGDMAEELPDFATQFEFFLQS